MFILVKRPVDGITINTQMETLLDTNGDPWFFKSKVEAKKILEEAGIDTDFVKFVSQRQRYPEVEYRFADNPENVFTVINEVMHRLHQHRISKAGVDVFMNETAGADSYEDAKRIIGEWVKVV